jgi:hypothetical protein
VYIYIYIYIYTHTHRRYIYPGLRKVDLFGINCSYSCLCSWTEEEQRPEGPEDSRGEVDRKVKKGKGKWGLLHGGHSITLLAFML